MSDSPGLSARVQVDSQSVDLVAIGELFSQVLGGGDNYIYGIVQSIEIGLYMPTTVTDVRLYADRDGNLVAYLPDAMNRGWLFMWNGCNPAIGTVCTVLDEALRRGAEALGIQEPPGVTAWYDWANPSATHMVAAVAIGDPINLQVVTPAGIIGPLAFSFEHNWNINPAPRNAGLSVTSGAGDTTILLPQDPFVIAVRTGVVVLEPATAYSFNDYASSSNNHNLGIFFLYSAF